MNPVLAKYNSLIASGKNIKQMIWQKHDTVKPTGLIYIFDDDTEEVLDISHLTQDEYKKYYMQLKVVWSFINDNKLID